MVGGAAVLWAVWKNTGCTGSRTSHHQLDCSHGRAFAYLDAWPVLVLWGVFVLSQGGPRSFYSVERAWRKEPKVPFPKVVRAEPVRTDDVLQSYRPRLGAYGSFALNGARTGAVLGDSTNTVIAREKARSSLYGLGSIYIDRQTGRRSAVWEGSFALPEGGLDRLVLETVPNAVVREKPSRDLGRYVSIADRSPYLGLSIVAFMIVLGATLVVVAGEGGVAAFYANLKPVGA